MNEILEAIAGIKYGEVIIKIQDSQIVQIERIEKLRINKADPKKEGNLKNITLTDQKAGG